MFTPLTNTKENKHNNAQPFHRMGVDCVIQCAKITSVKYQLELHPFQGFHILSLANFNHIQPCLQVLAQGDGWLRSETEVLQRADKHVVHRNPDGFRGSVTDAQPEIAPGGVRICAYIKQV